MKYDDASWHYGGDYPKGLPPENGSTHIAIFLAWAITRGHVGEIHMEDEVAREEVDRIRRGDHDPRKFFLKWCDEKLTDEDLSPEANAFATDYYGEKYYADLAATFPECGESLYHLTNGRETYEAMAIVIDKRYEEWRGRVA